MGLFRSKGKGQSDYVPPDLPGEHPTPSFQNDNVSQNNISNIPPIPPHLNTDSGYSGSYTDSNVSSNTSKADNRSAQKAARTTIVTTTTTTTTTTTVDSDGSTNTQVQPYNPTTDPPPASETTITSSIQPSNNENTNNVTEYNTVRRDSTSGGRPIPPRSELRNSQPVQRLPPSPAQTQEEYQPQSEYQPQPLSQYQPHSQYQPSPLSSHPLAPPPLSPARTGNKTYSNSNSNSNNNYTTAPLTPSQQQPPPPTTQALEYSPPLHSKRTALKTGMRALHGAGEALRGTVNATMAQRLGDEQEALDQRAVREQGLREVRDTGLRDRLPLAHGGKLRKRSLSRGLAAGEEGRRPLERVDEGEGRVGF